MKTKTASGKTIDWDDDEEEVSTPPVKSSNKKKKTPLATKTIHYEDGSVLRKGQRKPYKKATNEQIQQRTYQLANWMSSHIFASRWQIHKIWCEEWDLHWKMVDIYIGHARKIIQLWAKMSKDEAFETAIQVLRNAIKKGPLKYKLIAEKRLGEIYGYDAAKKMDVNLKQNPLEGKSPEQLLSIYNALEKYGRN